jgi:hypothetical protein
MSGSTQQESQSLPPRPTQPFPPDMPLHDLLEKAAESHWRGRNVSPEPRLFCPRRPSLSNPRYFTNLILPMSPHMKPTGRQGRGIGLLPRTRRQCVAGCFGI